MTGVAEFFEREAGGYARKPMGFRARHTLIARRIEDAIAGRVASIGGPWLEVRYPQRAAVSLFDLSFAMLARWASDPVQRVVADAAAPPLRPESLDHAVFPLILHHLTGPTLEDTRRMIGTAIRAVHDALKPGGRIWISEFSVSRAVYLTQNAASPLTRRVLALRGIPLVLMHPASVYVTLLAAAGFERIELERIRAPHESPLDRIQPIIGLEWLVIPKALYPVDIVLLTATKPSRPGESS